MAAWLNATQRPGDSALEDGRHDLVDATFHAAQTTALSPALPAHSPVSVPPAHPMLWKDNVGHADKPAVGIRALGILHFHVVGTCKGIVVDAGQAFGQVDIAQVFHKGKGIIADAFQPFRQ